MTSPRLSNLLEFLKGQGDVILIDSPPVLGPPDAVVLATMAEGTVLVVSAGLTKREVLQRAKDRLLAQQGVNLLGLTVNRAKLSGSVYSYSAHRGDGGREWRGEDGEEAWVTLGEAAAYLGISKAMARRWCKTGRLTARRSGLRRRVSWDDLDRLTQTRMAGDVVEDGPHA